jgi:hypothetical protein
MAHEQPILVWDMDQTLIGNPVDSKKLVFNDAALTILKRALNQNSINFLLTNNPADSYINMFTIALAKRLNVNSVFNGLMTATDSERTLDKQGVPVKQLADIQTLMRRADLPFSDETLGSRVYFFDDVPNHLLLKELPEGHYITITPAFYNVPSTPDETNYSIIRKVLGMSGGSKKKRQKWSRKSRLSRKSTRSTQKN